MRKRLLLLLFCLVTISSYARVVVQGDAPGYEGRKLAVVALHDEFSAKRVILAQCDIRDDGTFRIEFDVQSTQRVYLHIQRVEAPLYVQPESAYNVIFPLVSEKEYRRFDRTEVSLQFRELMPSDVNFIIRKFNADYALFIQEHFYDFATEEYKGSQEYLRHLSVDKSAVDLYARREAVDSTRLKVERGFGKWVSNFSDSIAQADELSLDAEFTNEYKRYALAELHLLSGMNRKLFYESYFMSITPRIHNPAYAGCFKLFSTNVLTGRKAGVQSAIIKAINVDRDLLRLAEALSPETELISDRLKQIAAISGLQDVYNNKSFDQSSIDILLKKVQTGDTIVDAMAAAVLFQVNRCKSGWPVGDFKFTDENQERWTLDNADGLPICMLFFASWSPNSQKEVLVLERWQEKFRGRIQFVAVCMDDDYRNYRKYLEENLKLPLKLLFGNAEPLVQEKFNLKAIPHIIFLDPKGLVLTDTCPLPSDPTFESFANRAAASTQPIKQGPKTWKDH
jgi:thiol-disulfide isomerase/thioredoxin